MPKKKTEEPTVPKKERPQNKNLKPENLTNLTSEERVRIAKKAGKASVKARRERKTLRETMERVSVMALHKGDLLDLDGIDNIDDLLAANKMLGEQIGVRLCVMASNGNLKAIELYREQMGEKPREEIALDVSGKVDVESMDINQLLEAIQSKKK